MLKKILIILGIVIALLGAAWGICYYVFHVRHMPFQFVCAVAMDGNTSAPLSFYDAPTEERFRFWIDTSDDVAPLVEEPDMSLFDFEKYDYLLFKGKRLKELTYSPWLSHTEDAICTCEDARTPLISTLEDASLDTLYIYRMDKTDKFRPAGP